MTMKTVGLISPTGDEKNVATPVASENSKNSFFSTDSSLANDSKKHLAAATYKAQKIRWLMLAIFICFTCINSIQWGQYVIISNLVQKFYDVPAYMVDYTTIAYMLAYIPLIFPALWLLEKMGVRFCLLLSCAGLSVGAWIKLVASLNPNFYYLVLVGQGTSAVFQVLAFGLAAKVTAIWFAANELSFACSLAVFGDQLGSAFGFLIPTIVVRGETKREIGTSLVNLNMCLASGATLILISTFICESIRWMTFYSLLRVFNMKSVMGDAEVFRERPKSPPSAAQALAGQQSNENILQSVKHVLKSRSFVFMMSAYGILVASFNSYISVLNSVFMKYFPVAEFHIGIISFLIMISGIIGSIIFGWLFDKTHKYKSLTFLLYICTIVIMIFNIFVPQQRSLALVYASNIIIGFFMIAFYSVAIQLAIEITFPVSESFVSSLLLLASHCLGIPFCKIYRGLFDAYGDVHSNVFICSALVIGGCLIYVIPPKLRRTSVNANANFNSQPSQAV